MSPSLGLMPVEADQTELELTVLNSDRYFNKVCKGKEQLTYADLEADRKEGAELGALRFFLKDGDKTVGLMEYVLHNSGDGYPWLGLFLIAKECQGQGYGKKALALFEAIMRERLQPVYRIGVVVGNEPARLFWTSMDFVKIKTVPQDKRLVDVYEKKVR